MRNFALDAKLGMMIRRILVLISSVLVFVACTTTGDGTKVGSATTDAPKQASRPIVKQKKLKLYALVIGNSTYKQYGLKNTTLDSKAIANKFRSMGFNVTELRDLNRRQFKEGAITFAEHAKDSDVTLFYYAGHGIQLNGTNYLLPIDMDFGGSEETATQDGVNLNTLIRVNLPGTTRIVFLDACRSNPFKSVKNQDGYEGLAPMNVAPGTLISFATRGGGVALDGAPGTNSPYTRALLQFIGQNKDVALMLRDVRDRVVSLTRNKQVPWEYGALSGGQIIIPKLATQ